MPPGHSGFMLIMGGARGVQVCQVSGGGMGGISFDEVRNRSFLGGSGLQGTQVVKAGRLSGVT